MQQTTVILITLVGYKALLIAIGWWASRKVHNQADFLLGGRQLGAWVAGLSYAASTSSAWVLLGFSGFVYTTGVSALWMLPGIWGGYVVMWLWFGPRIRREAADNQWLTPSEFLTANIDVRYQRLISAVAAALILFCFVFYIAAQFDAAAVAFVSNFDIDKISSLLIGASIILFYCLMGGFWAASVTDTLQGIVMMLCAVLLPVVAVIQAGGIAQVIDIVLINNATPYADWTGGMPLHLFLGFALGIAGIGLGTFGQPHLLARLMAVRGERERKQGFAIAMTWAVVVYVGMASLALAARSMNVDPGDGEQLFYVMANRVLPPVMAGLVIAAILSAVMSTVDSLLLAAAAAASHDLQLPRKFSLDELLVSRIVMTSIVIASLILAVFLPDTIFNRVLFAWNALGAAFGPVIFARLMLREPPAAARLLSILTGFGLTVLFYSLGNIALTENQYGLLHGIVELAHLPGDPFERIFPWIPAMLIVFLLPSANDH